MRGQSPLSQISYIHCRIGGQSLPPGIHKHCVVYLMESDCVSVIVHSALPAHTQRAIAQCSAATHMAQCSAAAHTAQCSVLMKHTRAGTPLNVATVSGTVCTYSQATARSRCYLSMRDEDSRLAGGFVHRP